MEREPVRQGQSDHGNATNGGTTRSNTASTTTPTPTPPRLTPNPTLLDSTHPAQTPTSSPPPPPLTPAPSLVSAPSHVPKTVAAPPPPHILVPAPPRLTSTGTPILRTYSRPILPSPMGAPKMSSSAPATMLALSSSSSSLRLPSSRPSVASNASPSSPSTTVASAQPPPPPLPFSSAAPSSVSPSSGTHSDAAAPPKSSAVLTNGNARPVSAHTSTAITPFHTPASPTGRQVTQALGTPGLVRANQISTPVRQRVSQQALLLGKGLKGSGQDQALLRAQMLQSLTLRPPPPGTLTIPPSLRLKRPVSSSAPPPLSRGLFPPLRPRPQPGATATESLALPIRPHLSVPPPTLYSPVRAVPLRPRLHSPNGHGGAPPRQSPALQPVTASVPAHTSQAPPINRHLVALKACPLSQAGQTQHATLSMAASPFERSPSAARQLQIIALSSGRQSQQGNGVHATHTSAQSAPPAAGETPEPAGQSQRTLSSRDTPPLPHQPLNPSMPKTTSSSSPSPPLSTSSPPSLPCPSSPAGPPFGPAPPQTHGLPVRQGEKQGGEERGQRGRGGAAEPRCGDGEEEIVGKDMRVRDNQRGADVKEREEEKRKAPVSNVEMIVAEPQEQKAQTEERMDVTEEGESEKERTVGGEKDEGQQEEGRESPMDQAENLTVRNQHRHRNSEPDCPEPNLRLATIQNSQPEPKATTPGLVATSSVPEPSAQNQRLAEVQREPIGQEDLCEDMSTQSDNQSALSSLSSQSPPSSPFVTPSSDRTPLLPPTPAQLAPHPANLDGLPRRQPDKNGQSQEDGAEDLDRSEDESESNGCWAPRPWPEGRQVLTHLVEGFVIQEGLQPFPVKHNSLLVEPVQSATPPPQEVNGTNGTAAVSPEAQRPSERAEHSTDTDEGEGGATDDPGGTNSGQKDKVVLHCQFCGKRGHAHNFMRSKRFCSTSCARGFNIRLTKRLRALSAGSSRPERARPALQRAESVPGKPLLLRLPRVLWTATRREAEEKGEEGEEEEEKDGEEEVDEEEPAVVVTAKTERRGAARRTRRTASEPAMAVAAPTTPTTTYKPVPAHWSVEEVTAFIHTLPGCSEVAEAFRVQEIDGQALLLLTEDHLMTSMNIKLGPALKICAHINALKHQ